MLAVLVSSCVTPGIVHVQPGTVVAIQFLDSREAVKGACMRLDPDFACRYRYLKAAYFGQLGLILVSAPDFDPGVLAHEICNVAGKYEEARDK